MSQDHGGRDITKTAENDLSDYQYRFVEVGGSAGQVDLPDADTDIPVGVLQNQPAAGETAQIRIDGTSKAKAKGSISEGDLLAPAAVATAADKGKVRTLPTSAGTYYIVGRALETASDADVFEIQILTPVQRVISG